MDKLMKSKPVAEPCQKAHRRYAADARRRFLPRTRSRAERSGAKNNFDLLIQSGDKDLSKQQSQIDNFIVQKVDAIIVCPTDTRGIAPAIERANAANIPVFTADIAAGGGKIVSHVASDNTAGGRLAAEYIVKAIGGEGEKSELSDSPKSNRSLTAKPVFKEEIAKTRNNARADFERRRRARPRFESG
jgi:ABC-type sugar transport system substrate-binding protein